jgi:hypothetical protein
VPPDNLPAHLLQRGLKRKDPAEDRRFMQDENKLRMALGMRVPGEGRGAVYAAGARTVWMGMGSVGDAWEWAEGHACHCQ